jgi:hypothetical protein
MTAPKTQVNPRQKYQVLQAFACPNKKHWHKAGEELELLPCEADFLLLSCKICVSPSTATTKADKPTKGEN